MDSERWENDEGILEFPSMRMNLAVWMAPHRYQENVGLVEAPHNNQVGEYLDEKHFVLQHRASTK